MLQYKQVHTASGCVRFLDNEGKVLGWEGRIPAGDVEWEDAGTFDPYAYLAEVKTNRHKEKNKNSVAARNLYDKLIARGYTPVEASASTGYVP